MMKKIGFVCLLMAAFSYFMAGELRAETVFESDIKYQKSFYSDGKKYTMYWVASAFYKDESDWLKANNGVNKIYIVPDAIIEDYRKGRRVKMNNGNGLVVYNEGKKWWSTSYDVPQLCGIVIHDLNDSKKSFIGVLVETTVICDGSNPYGDKRVVWEIKVPEDIADEMYDLTHAKTRFNVQEGSRLDKMFGGINMKMVKTPNLQPYTFQ